MGNGDSEIQCTCCNDPFIALKKSLLPQPHAVHWKSPGGFALSGELAVSTEGFRRSGTLTIYRWHPFSSMRECFWPMWARKMAMLKWKWNTVVGEAMTIMKVEVVPLCVWRFSTIFFVISYWLFLYSLIQEMSSFIKPFTQSSFVWESLVTLRPTFDCGRWAWLIHVSSVAYPWNNFGRRLGFRTWWFSLDSSRSLISEKLNEASWTSVALARLELSKAQPLIFGLVSRDFECNLRKRLHRQVKVCSIRLGVIGGLDVSLFSRFKVTIVTYPGHEEQVQMPYIAAVWSQKVSAVY